MKCSVCCQEKDEESFNWKNRAQGRRASACRICWGKQRLQSYQKNRADVIAKVRQRSRANVDRYHAWKATLKCSLCPESESVCLDLHHVDPAEKEFALSAAIASLSWDKLMAEVAKCIVVCKNCHAKIHAGKVFMDTHESSKLE